MHYILLYIVELIILAQAKMSSHYDPIPTDSDGEDEHVSDSMNMSGDDARSDRTRSTDRTGFLHPRVAASESEPEEDNPADVDLRRPLNGHTASETAPTHSPPRFIDPYTQSSAGFRLWEHTLRTLQRWRDNGRYTRIPSGEGSSNTRQEFLMDTTPILVDKIMRHEEKIDMMEDVIMGMPGDDAVEEIRDQVKDVEENTSYVNDEVQSLKKRVEAMAQKFQEMDCSIRQMERQMGDCHTMTAMAQGITSDKLREFFKKDGSG